MFIETIMAEGGEPNLTVWNASRNQIEGFFADPTITTYHVRARSTSAAQLVVTINDVPGHGYRTLWIRPRTPEVKASHPAGFPGIFPPPTCPPALYPEPCHSQTLCQAPIQN